MDVSNDKAKLPAKLHESLGPLARLFVRSFIFP